MRSSLQDRLAPAVERQRSLDEALAKRRRGLGLGVLLGAGVIAEHLEPPAVQLAQPALDRDFPVGMLAEEPADDPYPDRLARLWRTRQCRRGISLGHDATDQRSVERLQVAGVAALIGQVERLVRPDHFGEIPGRSAMLDLVTQRDQLLA